MNIDIDKVKANKTNITTSKGNINIDSIYIEQNGELEKMIYNDCGLHELKSCAKMVTAMAIGIALDRKMQVNGVELSLDTMIYPVIKNVANITNQSNLDKISKWTVRDMLTHTAGYKAQISSEHMIVNVDKEHMIDYVLNYDIPFDIGTRYAYNNAEPFILSVFFEEAFGINLADFVAKNIFEKLDIIDYEWLNYGKYCASATGLYLKHEDFHKLGQLILNDGFYNNSIVIPKWWMDEMFKMQIETPSEYKPERLLPKVGAGYFTFISRDGYVFRDGANGQYIIVNKEKGLLITVMSTEKEMQYVTEVFRGIL